MYQEESPKNKKRTLIYTHCIQDFFKMTGHFGLCDMDWVVFNPD